MMKLFKSDDVSEVLFEGYGARTSNQKRKFTIPETYLTLSSGKRMPGARFMSDGSNSILQIFVWLPMWLHVKRL